MEYEKPTKFDLVINQLSSKIAFLTTELAVAYADKQILKNELDLIKEQLKEDSDNEPSSE